MRRVKIGVFLSFFLAMSALGRGEVQWLRYRVVADFQREYSISNRISVELSSDAPQDVELPEFKTDSPFFAKWATPLDERGHRWIALDRSGSRGLGDLLYIDTNGDGRLDDETPHKGQRTDTYRVRFDPIAVYLDGEDGPITYHLIFEFQRYDARNPRLSIGSAGCYEGTVLIDGDCVPCVLVDYTVNGVFNDASGRFNADRILLGDDSNRKEHFVGRYLEYGDALYRLNIAQDGAFVAVTAAPDVKSGVVTMPDNLSTFTAGGVNGLFERKVNDGQMRLPEGTYRVYHWQINRIDKGQYWTLSGSGFPREHSFEVSADAPVALAIGEPVSSRLSVRQQQGTYSINQYLRGLQGERISLMQNNSRPPAPKVHIRSQDGTYDRTFSLEYG